MKKVQNKTAEDDLQREYVLDYSKSKPNRFADRLKNTTTVVLQPEVAAIFRSSEVVNELLRSAITATKTAVTKQRLTSSR